MRNYFLEMSSRHINSDNLRENSKRSCRCKIGGPRLIFNLRNCVFIKIFSL